MESYKIKLGKRIRELRKAKGLTQEKLAEDAQLDYTSIGAIERGVFNPSIESALRIAKALKIEINDLILTPEKIAVTEKEILIERIKSQLEKTDIKTLRLIDSLLQNIISWTKKHLN
jgi:transcriptional regulator with XRE-family HTH domain